MEFDATQALDLSDLAEEQDVSEGKNIRGYLRLLAQKDLEEHRYPLMDGDNVIGRGETCHVHIKSKVLSKEHACIEIINQNHFIYDKDSRNKTRRGKIFLKPEARFELNDRDKLVFGDVICIYEKVRKRYGSGSDTDGETQAMALTQPPEDRPALAEEGGDRNGGAETEEKDESDAESHASSDLLGPPRLPAVGATPSGESRVLADDTPTSAKHLPGQDMNESDAFIPESQFVGNNGASHDESITDLLPKRPTDHAENESDVTDDESNKAASGAKNDVPALLQPTQGDDTQGYPGLATPPRNTEPLTQATPDSTQMLSPSPRPVARNPYQKLVSTPSPSRVLDDSTQLLGPSPVSERRNPYKKEDAEFVSSSSKFVAETPSEPRTPDVEPRQFDPVSSNKRVPSRTAVASTPPSSASFHLMPSIMSLSPVEAASQQAIKLPPLDESDDAPDLGPSQIVYNSQSSPRPNMPDEEKASPIISRLDMPKPTPKSCFKEKSILKVKQEDSESKTPRKSVHISDLPATEIKEEKEEEATQAPEVATQKYGGEATQTNGEATQAYGEATQKYGGEATQKYGGEATQAYGGEATQAYSEATQKYGGEATQAYGEATQKYAGEATQRYGGESTQAMGEATQKYGGESTQAYGEATQKFGGEATQRYGEATQKYGGEATQAYGDATQKYGEEATQKYGGEATQVYGEATQKYGGEATQRYGGEATQRYGGEATQAYSGEATQAYDAATQKYGGEATQAYGGATQKYGAHEGQDSDSSGIQTTQEFPVIGSDKGKSIMDDLEPPQLTQSSDSVTSLPSEGSATQAPSHIDLEPPAISQRTDSPDVARESPAVPSESGSSHGLQLAEDDSSDSDSVDLLSPSRPHHQTEATKKQEVAEEPSSITPEPPSEIREAPETEMEAETQMVTETEMDAETQMEEDVVPDSDPVPETPEKVADTEILPDQVRAKVLEGETEDEPPVLEPENEASSAGANDSTLDPPTDLTMVAEAKPARARRGRQTKATTPETEPTRSRRQRKSPEAPKEDIVLGERTTQVHSSEFEESAGNEEEEKKEEPSSQARPSRSRRKEPVVVERPKRTGRRKNSTTESIPDSIHEDEEDLEEEPAPKRGRKARAKKAVVEPDVEQEAEEEEVAPKRARKSRAKKSVVEAEEEDEELVAPKRGRQARAKKAVVEQEEEEEEEEATPSRRSRRKKDPKPEPEPETRSTRPRRKKAEETDTSVESTSRRRTRTKVELPPPETTPPKGRGKNEAAKTPASSRKRGASTAASDQVGGKKSRTSEVALMSPRQQVFELKLIPKVLFTGVVDEKGSKTIEALGGEVVTSPQSCTHLVTDKVRRTVKFLCCLGRGIPIVSYHWLDKCRQAKKFVDHDPYIISDSENESHYQFNLRDSIEIARENQLFLGWRIHVTKSVQPVRPDMAEIIKSAGGTPVATMPKSSGENLLIVSCDEDERSCSQAISTGITIVTSECILTGLLQQKIDIDKYRLFAEAAAAVAEENEDDAAKKSKTSRRKRKR